MEIDREYEIEEETLSDSSMEGLKEQIKSMMNSISWLKYHWPSKAPKKDHSCQISKNLEHFLSFLKFLMQKTGFFSKWRCAFVGGIHLQKKLCW